MENSIKTYTLNDALKAMEFLVYGNPTEDEIKAFKKQCKASIPFKMERPNGKVLFKTNKAENIVDASSFYNRGSNVYVGD